MGAGVAGVDGRDVIRHVDLAIHLDTGIAFPTFFVVEFGDFFFCCVFSLFFS